MAKSGEMAAPPELSPEQFEWIQVQRDLAQMNVGTGGLDKIHRKFSENPFVPLGCLVTAGVLTAGLYNFRKGNMQMSQKMMRYRIYAQGFTFISLVIGVTLGVSANHNKKA